MVIDGYFFLGLLMLFLMALLSIVGFSANEPLLLLLACLLLLCHAMIWMRRVRDPFHPVPFISIVYVIYATFLPIGNLVPTALFQFSDNDLLSGYAVMLPGAGGILLASLFVGIPPQAAPIPPSKPIIDVEDPPIVVAHFFTLVGISMILLMFARIGFGNMSNALYMDRFDLWNDFGYLNWGYSALSIGLVIYLIRRGPGDRMFGYFVFGFLMLCAALTARRYLMVTALFTLLTVYHYRRRRIPVATYLFGLAGALVLFMALGVFRRLVGTEYSLDDVLALLTSGQVFDLTLHGEFRELFLTAIRSFEGFVEPLPYFQDYLMSWQMSLPRFLIGEDRIINLNVRYAFAVDPIIAAAGRGYGFLLVSEAVVVFGVLGPPVVMFLFVSLSCWFYRAAARCDFGGLVGTLYLLYMGFMFWAQRGCFAIFFKSYVLWLAVPLILTVWTWHLIAPRLREAPSRRQGYRRDVNPGA